eukprot:GFKZ01011372.1.p1 GENE.GFKZ01011372.1~~GFKZ01011372.1.p1  ORF type:complete len:858 (-),score=86.53 GFKZ01011372.1:156-2729(-)
MWSGHPFFPAAQPPLPLPAFASLQSLPPPIHLLPPLLPALSNVTMSSSANQSPRPSSSRSRPLFYAHIAPVQHFERNYSTRLLDNMDSLVTVIMTVVMARVQATKSFMAAAHATPSSYDIRDLARKIPVPRLSKPDMFFYASVFTAACDVIPTIFDGPCADVRAFLTGLVERSAAYGEEGVSNSALLMMMIYVDRLFAKCPALMLTEENAVRIMAAAYAVAVKMIEDVSCGTVAMARVLGLDWKDVCQLEAAFLRLIDYELHVSVEALADAEVAFMAEALEAAGGAQVLRNLHVAGIRGLERALEVAGNWRETEHASAPTLASEYWDGMSDCMLFTGDRKFWRTFPAAGCELVGEAEMPERIIGLACAQYHIDFQQIKLSVEEEKGTWYAMAVCERDGLNRYQRLRAIMLNQDLSVTELPQMRKRPEPYMAIPGGKRRAPGDDFVAALGENGAGLVAEGWETALAVPDPIQEGMEDAGLELPPLPSPVWHIARRGRNGRQSRDDTRGPVEGRRDAHSSIPCTPVGSPGGLVSVDPPMFHDPEMLEQIRCAPPSQEIPEPEPRQPPGFYSYEMPLQQEPSLQQSHAPGFPLPPPSIPSPCFPPSSIASSSFPIPSAPIGHAQEPPIGPALPELNGPPGFPRRPTLANHGKPPGFPSLTASSADHAASFLGREPRPARRPRSIWRDEEEGTFGTAAVPEPPMESGTKRFTNYYVEYAHDEALVQASMAAGGCMGEGAGVRMGGPVGVAQGACWRHEGGASVATTIGRPGSSAGATDCSSARIARMKSRFDQVAGIGGSLFSSQPFLDQTRQQATMPRSGSYSPSTVAGNGGSGRRCGRKRGRVEAWEVGAGAGAANWRR